MDDLCKNCGVCCKLIPIDWNNKTLLRNGIQNFDEEFEDNLVPISLSEAQEINSDYIHAVQKLFPNAEFFSCKYISSDNTCTNSQKPDICENFPSEAFACITENCPFTGDIFLKQEKLKQKIRRLKEEIIDYQTQLNITKDKHEREHLNKIIIHHQKYIGRYKIFGSKNW